MLLHFTKMNGAGNDFILIDNRERTVRLSPEQVVRLCHRQRGIGADGIMLLVPPSGTTADWAWDFYNSDGSSAEMCGNGARCFARFIQKVAGARDRVAIQTVAGIITAEFQKEGRVTVNLTSPKDMRLNETVPMSTGAQVVHSVNTGVPHAVVFVSDADKAMVQTMGAEIRYHVHFKPRGTNVNFVQVLGPNSIRVRTYERGVEGETLACGTGVAASALISASVHGFSGPVKVRVQGGDELAVSFRKSGEALTDVRLTGPADFVFEGQVEI